MPTARKRARPSESVEFDAATFARLDRTLCQLPPKSAERYADVMRHGACTLRVRSLHGDRLTHMHSDGTVCASYGCKAKGDMWVGLGAHAVYARIGHDVVWRSTPASWARVGFARAFVAVRLPDSRLVVVWRNGQVIHLDERVIKFCVHDQGVAYSKTGIVVHWDASTRTAQTYRTEEFTNTLLACSRYVVSICHDVTPVHVQVLSGKADWIAAAVRPAHAHWKAACPSRSGGTVFYLQHGRLYRFSRLRTRNADYLNVSASGRVELSTHGLSESLVRVTSERTERVIDFDFLLRERVVALDVACRVATRGKRMAPELLRRVLEMAGMWA